MISKCVEVPLKTLKTLRKNAGVRAKNMSDSAVVLDVLSQHLNIEPELYENPRI